MGDARGRILQYWKNEIVSISEIELENTRMMYVI